MLSDTITRARYCVDGEVSWFEVANRVVDTALKAVPASRELRNTLLHFTEEKKFVPGGRILRGAGGQMSNCFLFDVEDSREGWGELAQKATVTLMTGGGIGVNYARIRPSGAHLSRTGGIASGPIPLIYSINEIGRGVQCGGFRRSAIYASLPWDHPDIFSFIHLKDWPEWIQERRKIDINTPAPGDMTNISVALNPKFFAAYENRLDSLHSHAVAVYNELITNMCLTGEPGIQVDYDGQTLRNACTEIISDSDSDSCVLGAINFANVKEDELEEVTDCATAFLLAVTEANISPTAKCKEVQRRNRRLGLELMGLGEWFLQRELPYGHRSIVPWLATYRDQSERAADCHSAAWNLPRPVAVRAVGPTGTISLVAETTSGIEPLLSPAYERRYLTKNGFASQVLVDPVAKRLYQQGHKEIESAYDISVERRVSFQVLVQRYVDNAISSTINLADMGTDPRWFGETIYPNLRLLRGLTAFPNGSRGLQPITPVELTYALNKEYELESQDSACPSGVCSV